ncbi:hypothetical protein [Sorangium sp. So ce1078]|uniref:hypothetical protein n=1 Tax=Sorangium sp. So ce1078 TaxID=3133329 RepID=UPI003F6043C6
MKFIAFLPFTYPGTSLNDSVAHRMRRRTLFMHLYAFFTRSRIAMRLHMSWDSCHRLPPGIFEFDRAGAGRL